MSQTTVDLLAHTMANPPEGDALPELVTSMRERRDYLRKIKASHLTALTRERGRFQIASGPISPFSMERPHSLRLIATYEETVKLHNEMLKTLHENWVKFHQYMKEGARLLFGEGKVVEGGVVKNVEQGIQFARDAKLCLDRIEWALFEWRKGVMKAMVGISEKMASQWRDALSVWYPVMLGKEKPRVPVRSGHDGRASFGGRSGRGGRRQT